MRNQLSPQDYQTLSDYLDGQLPARDRSRLEARLAAQPALKEELEEIRRLRLMLRSLPKRRAPRNFTLTPEMVGVTRAKPARPALNLFPAFRLASFVAALLFVFALVGPMALGLGSRQTAATSAPAAGSEMTGMAAPEAAPLTTATAITAGEPSTMAQSNKAGEPPIITWGGGARGMGGGGGLGGAGGSGQVIGGGDGIGGPIGGGTEIDPTTGQPVDGAAPVSPNTGIVAATPVPLAQVAPDAAQPEAGANDMRTFGHEDTTVENSGPIMGIQKAAPGAEPVPTLPNPTPQPASPAGGGGAAEVTPPTANPALLYAQVGLGFVALVTALAALYFYRKERL